MAGICSRHQHYDKRCSICNAMPEHIPTVHFQVKREDRFISFETGQGENSLEVICNGKLTKLTENEARELARSLFKHFLPEEYLEIEIEIED